MEIMKWNPVGKRKRGRPKAHWAPDLVKQGGNSWVEVAEDRDSWSSKREVFIQQ